MMKLTIEYQTRCPSPRGARPAIVRAAQAAAAVLPATLRRKLDRKPHALSVTLVTGPTIRSLNRQYRHKDKVTDVLSFSRWEDPYSQGDVGDVIVCASRARVQAPEWNNTYLRELQRLTIHGVLHLFGYDHEISKREAVRMERLEKKALARLFPNGFDGINGRRPTGRHQSRK